MTTVPNAPRLGWYEVVA